MADLINIIDQRIRRALGRVRGASYGTLRKVREEGKRLYCDLAGLPEEDLNSARLFQQYGFASHPLEGAQTVLVMIGGRSRQAVVIASEDERHRVSLEPGQVAMFTDEGDLVVLERGQIRLESDTIIFNGGDKPINRQGDGIEINATTDSGFIAWLNIVHTILSTLGGPAYTTAVSAAGLTMPISTVEGETKDGNDTVLG